MKPGIGRAVALAMAVAGTLRPAAAQTTELRFNWWIPPTHMQRTLIADLWAKAVAEATQGRVKITFTTTSLGPPPRQFDLVKDGIADIAVAAHGYNPDRFILAPGVELPFVGNSAEATSVALWRAYEKFFAAKNEFAGVKVLGLYAHGPGGVWTREKVIRSMDDFKGLKIRSGGGAQDEAVKLLGAVAVTSPAPTSYEILSKGVADATLFDYNGVPAFKLEKIVKSFLEIPGGLYVASFYYVINEAKWAALAKADQEAIMQVSGEALAKLAGKAWDKVDADAAAQLPGFGITVTKADGKLLADMQAALKPLEDKYVATVKEKRGLDGAEIMKFIRDTTASYRP
jgi:TRAP-type C4-dicarboxylate transport system substrate-binding protein